MRVDQDRELGLAKHVNEARRNDHAVRVNGAFGLRRAQKADGGNFAVANADVARVPGRAGTVNDVAVADDQVEGGGRGAGGEKTEDSESSDQQRSKMSGHEAEAPGRL